MSFLCKNSQIVLFLSSFNVKLIRKMYDVTKLQALV